MTKDVMGAIVEQLSHSAVGLIRRVEDKGSEVVGSGVLVRIDKRRGILTAGHVAELFKPESDIGWVRFTSGSRHRTLLNLTDAQTLIFESSSKWTKTDADLAFIFLGPETASSVEARGVFINMELNQEKIEGASPEGRCVDVIFGLVKEYSGKPFIEDGEFVSDMRAVAYAGDIRNKENGLYEVELRESDLQKLPLSFGGVSGGGLWRVYFVEKQGEGEITGIMLAGIASWEQGKTIACQGYERIYQGLVLGVREKLPQ